MDGARGDAERVGDLSGGHPEVMGHHKDDALLDAQASAGMLQLVAVGEVGLGVAITRRSSGSTWISTAGTAGGPLRELQRPQGAQPKAALNTCSTGTRSAWRAAIYWPSPSEIGQVPRTWVNLSRRTAAVASQVPARGRTTSATQASSSG